MARRVQKSYRTAILEFSFIGRDVLGDASGLAFGNLGFSYVIQKSRLAVIDMTHDNHDGRPLNFGFFVHN
jgi:hypothetical protein